MKFGQNSINSLLNKIKNRELAYENSIIIGDNASGKSCLLNCLISQFEDKKDIYFIDAVNRSFDVSKVMRRKEKPAYKNTILATRLQENKFNLEDSFNCYGTSTERIEEIYSAFEVQIQNLFQRLTGETFEIVYGSNMGEVRYEGGEGLLSSGYQAMVRLLLELVYFQEMGVQNNQLSKPIVIIDELDEFLSPRYASKIYPFIRANFPKIKFIVTTHSIDLVVEAKEANLIVLDEDGFEVMDVNDYNSYSEVQIIFNRLFGNESVPGTETENKLRRLLNNKINHAWTEDDDYIMKSLEQKKLTASQQLIYRQIKDWE